MLKSVLIRFRFISALSARQINLEWPEGLIKFVSYYHMNTLKWQKSRDSGWDYSRDYSLKTCRIEILNYKIKKFSQRVRSSQIIWLLILNWFPVFQPGTSKRLMADGQRTGGQGPFYETIIVIILSTLSQLNGLNLSHKIITAVAIRPMSGKNDRNWQPEI